MGAPVFRRSCRSRFVRRPVALDESVRDGEREMREDPAEDGSEC
jgi:hypothetical protein